MNGSTENRIGDLEREMYGRDGVCQTLVRLNTYARICIFVTATFTAVMVTDLASRWGDVKPREMQEELKEIKELVKSTLKGGTNDGSDNKRNNR